MQQTKIQFRALRECVGLSLAEMAERLQVNVRSVKRWESLKYPDYKPPKDAWELLETLHNKQIEVVKVSEPRELEYIRKGGAVKNATARAQAAYWLATGKCSEVQFVESDEYDNNN